MHSTHLSTTQAAALLGVLPDTLRHIVRKRGSYSDITPRKLANGELSWPRAAVLAALPDSDLSPAEREAWAALEACAGPLRLTKDERGRLLSVVYSLPHEHRHDLQRLLAQADLARRALCSFDRAELTFPVDRGGQVTLLSPFAQRQLAEALGAIAERAQQMRMKLLDAATAAGKALP